MINNYLELIFPSAILIIGSGIGRVFNASTTDWYTALAKPAITPPGWIFGPVWTLLYISIGILLARLWRHKDENKLAIAILITNLAFNFLWTPLFFYFNNIGLALIDSCLILCSIIFLMITLKNKSGLVVLTLPYFCWVSFATLLNLLIYIKN